MSLQAHIYEYLKERPNEWVNGGVFEDMARSLKKKDGTFYKASNASRRCRDLEEAGSIESRINEKRCVEYKYKPLLDQIKPPTTPSRPLQASFFPERKIIDSTKI